MLSQQPPLFELEEPRSTRERGKLDADSEALLERYAEVAATNRLLQTVRGEVSQLRSLVRIAHAHGGPRTLPGLLGDLPALADALTSPGSTISESTGRCRLRAVESALLLDVPYEEGRFRQDRLVNLLPKRATKYWHESEVRVAGSRARLRVQSATIEPDDLARIVDASPAGRNARQAARNRALVAVHCFSGLQAGEIRSLRWDQVRWDPAIEGWRASLERGARTLELPILGRGAAALARWRLDAPSLDGEGSDGLIFPGIRANAAALTEPQIRTIVRAATSAVGFEHAGRSELRSAFAAWGQATFCLTDHELARVLGVADVGTVDRLLARQRSIEWQRRAAVEPQNL